MVQTDSGYWSWSTRCLFQLAFSYGPTILGFSPANQNAPLTVLCVERMRDIGIAASSDYLVLSGFRRLLATKLHSHRDIRNCYPQRFSFCGQKRTDPP